MTERHCNDHGDLFYNFGMYIIVAWASIIFKLFIFMLIMNISISNWLGGVM